jgi:hypothetical protein
MGVFAMTNLVSKTAAAGLAALLLLGAGTSAAQAARMCPMIYAPVCARTPTGHLKTYSNACMARVAHARILYRGRCRMHHR